MTNPQKIEGGWEKRFDKEFPFKFGYDKEIGIPIKSFISDLLASERQRCVEFLKEKIEDDVIGIFNGNGLSAKEQRSRLDEILEQLK